MDDNTGTGNAPEVAAKIYLGDGACAYFYGMSISVTAENGVWITDRVVLERAALQQLVDFARRHGMQID